MLDALIAKYDRPVPRYTSYPTAVQFTDPIGPAAEAAWLATVPAAAPVSLYLHVPFCLALCHYCGCNTTATRRRPPIAQFRDRLLAEIDLVADHLGRRQPVAHLHWGGGTPNILAADDLRALMRRLAARFDLSAAEIAIELDPRHLSAEQIEALRDGGFTRASLGVQDFDPAVQAAIGRLQPFAQVATAVERLRDAGIAGINLDLMYGLPLQTAGSVARSAALAAELAADRVALFGYAHVPWMKRHQLLLEQYPLPDGRQRWQQAARAAEALAARGYQAVGLDHFALPHDPLAVAARNRRLHRNFQGYTTDAAEVLIGLGPSAISRYPEGFAQSATAVPAWSAAVDLGRRPTVRGRVLAADDRRRAAVIERIMCDGEIDLAGQGFEAELDAADALAADGLVERHGTALRVTPRGRPLLRTVAALFDRYFDREAGRHARAV